MEQIDIDEINYLTKFDQIFGEENVFNISIIGWQDGDYFEQLCDEDGGVNDSHLHFFYNLPLGKKVNRLELNHVIGELQRFPFLSSKNKHYKFHYDLHIWSKKFYVVYNSCLQRLIFKKLNFIERVVFPAILPPWQHDKNSY